jgi:hypothetical protein
MTVAAWGPWCWHCGDGRCNLALGLTHGPVGALVSAWPASALVVCSSAWLRALARKG